MKCLVLLSGGLDSALAAALCLEEGFSVEGVNMVTGFEPRGQGLDHPALVAASLGIALHRPDIHEAFLDLLKGPEFGFGRNLNPCVDCKILMFREAWRLAGERGASFLVTGEVVGQRPMSQQREKMLLIERRAGIEGKVFRPLSAGLLPPSFPEDAGLVERAGLLSFQGRQRRELLDLAVSLGVTGFGTPAGGCLLTDRAYSRRLRDLMDHGSLERDSVSLLKTGRHLRLSPAVKAVVGRDLAENRLLLKHLGPGMTGLFSFERGPVALLEGKPGEREITLAARAVSSYSFEGRLGRPVRVGVIGRNDFLVADPLPKEELARLEI